MKKTSLMIMLITLFSKVLGFGRDIVLSYFFGASNISDAYIISLTIPSVIFGFIVVGIATVYIPMQSRVINDAGEDAGSKFTSNFTNIILLIVTVFLCLGLLFTEPIIKLFASGFNGETLARATSMTKITLFGMYFTALISVFSGYLQIKNNYIIPALLGFPLNIIVIISIFLSSKGNYNILAIGMVIATASQFILMLPFIVKENFKYKFFVDFKDENIKKALFITLPIVIGVSVNKINILVDRTIASSLAVGGISSLTYANRLNLFVQGVFVTSILVAMYPMISEYASKKNYKGVKNALMESVNIIAIFIIPITIGAMIFNKQIVNLLFARGEFDGNAIQMTSTALYFYAIGMFGVGLREVLARGFYSMQNTKTPMINAAL